VANRSYIYSLSNQPTSYSDRPETITGLSEWAYNIPFLYRLLASADPKLCASLVSDTLDDVVVPLHAITSPFDPGFERVRRFAEILKALPPNCARPTPAPKPAAPTPAPSIMSRLLNLVGRGDSAPAPQPAPPIVPRAWDHVPGWLDETLTFLEQHRNAYVLLETIELDTMVSSSPEALRNMVEAEIARCRHVGDAFNALPNDIHEAARVLESATIERKPAPLDAFFGISLDDTCDSGKKAATYPLGLQWDEELYFSLMNREEFEEHQRSKA